MLKEKDVCDKNSWRQQRRWGRARRQNSVRCVWKSTKKSQWHSSESSCLRTENVGTRSMQSRVLGSRYHYVWKFARGTFSITYCQHLWSTKFPFLLSTRRKFREGSVRVRAGNKRARFSVWHISQMHTRINRTLAEEFRLTVLSVCFYTDFHEFFTFRVNFKINLQTNSGG